MATREPAQPTRPSPRSGAKPRSVAFYLILAAALFAFMQTFWLLAPILLSFLLILLITLAINPIISWMRGLRGGRGLPTGLILIGLFLTIALTGWAFFGPMANSVGTLSEQVPLYWERLQKPLIRMEQKAVQSEAKLQAEVTLEIADAERAADSSKPAAPIPTPAPATSEPAPPKAAAEPGSIRSSIMQMLNGVAGGFTAMAFNAAQLLVVLVTVFFGVTYTLLNPRPIFGTLFSLIPERQHNQAAIISRRIGAFVPQWAGATLVGMVTIGVLVFLLMWPIFGFVDALILGIIAGVLEAIPFLGPVLSAVPALLLALGKGGMTPLWVVLAYLAIQALESNVILPMIMARSMKLHPVAVIFSMLLCVAAFGVLGVLVAAPLVAIVAILHEELYRKRFLPSVTDADLDRLARNALHEKPSAAK
jgi:predicted PurR-regulated permease PerM